MLICYYVFKKDTMSLLFEFGVGEAGVVDVFELLDEDGLGVGDVTEGDGAFTEIALGHLCVDKTVHQLADGLLRIVW